MISVLHNDELAEVLEVNGAKKLDLKIDNSGNVQFEKSATGLKGTVQLPETFDPATLNQKIAELEQAKAAAEAKVQELETKVQQLEAREDIKLSGAELDDATNELKLTLVDGQEIKTSLAKFVDAPKSAQEYWNEIKALPTFKADLVALIKGEEVQNFAGQTKGFLISA
ncbi:hypothetical protein ACWIYZ_04950 [Ursidibacter arcticus]